MEPSTFIAPFIGLIAPLIISAVRTPGTRIQDRTLRLQYWKTYFEVAALSGMVVDSNANHMCQKELLGGQDEAANLQHSAIGWIAAIYTYIAMFLFLAWLGQITGHTLILLQHQGRPKQEQDQLLYVCLTVQGVVAASAWFVLRWRVRDYIWSAFGPGKQLGNRFTVFVTLTFILAGLLIMYLQVTSRIPIQFPTPSKLN